MINILKKKQLNGETVTLKIDGMHCVACSLNIDDALEELDGVYESRTNYAKAETVVRYSPQKVSTSAMVQAIRTLGYQVV